MDKGPKRSRHPAREELRMELRKLENSLEVARETYYRLNPRIAEDFFFDRETQTEDVILGIENKGDVDSFLDDSIAITELDDMSLSMQEEAPGDNKAVQKNKEQLEAKIGQLRKLLASEYKKIGSIEALIKKKKGSMLKFANYKGDLDDLKKGLQDETVVLDNLRSKNREVEKKIEMFQEMESKGENEQDQTVQALMNKLSDLKSENRRFLESQRGVEDRMNSGGDVKKLKIFLTFQASEEYRNIVNEIGAAKQKYDQLQETIKAATQDLEYQKEDLQKTEE